MRTRTGLILACTLGLLAALGLPASARAAEPWKNWTAPLLSAHALVGKIWSAREARYVAPHAVAEALQDATFLLLGETHDNPDHHRLQAWLVSAAAKSRRPPVIMEMIGMDQALVLRSYLAQPDATAAGLGPAIGWEQRGWPPWPMYQPIAEAALAHGLEIRPGDIARPMLRKAGRQGLETLGTERLAELKLDTSLGDALTADLLDELYDSHCQVMPRDALAPMSGIQRLRDAVLADSLIAGATGGAAILIAGNGHVRTDRAVPWYLTRRAPRTRIVTVMLIEVEADAKTAMDLVPAGPDGKPATDYVWFTPRAERADPCESLRKRFQKGAPAPAN